MKKIAYIVFAAVVLAGCYKVDIHWKTDHPTQGKIILTTDWSKHTEGVEVPSIYTVHVVDPAITLSVSEKRFEFPNLFNPGTYTLYFYNSAEGIDLNGTVVSFHYDPPEANVLGLNRYSLMNKTGKTLKNTPLSRGGGEEMGVIYGGLYGVQFWGSLTQTIEADRDYDVVVPMRQITRQLEFDFTIIEGDPEWSKENVWLDLYGIAGAWDCEADKPVGPSSVMSVVMDRQGSKVTGMTRLLGLADGKKILEFELDWADSYDWDTYSLDVTELLAGFNAEDRTPVLVLKGNIHLLDDGGERSVTISDLTIEERKTGEEVSMK